MTFDLYDLRRERRLCGHVDGRGLQTIYGTSPIIAEEMIETYGQCVIGGCVVVVEHGKLPPWEHEAD